MSSMRNAVSRRNHKERSQPEARQKWGILEKHKDYSLRAQDYNAKKRKINILSQKSRERHQDEFAFGMLSSDKAVQGKHGRRDQEKNRLAFDTVKLLKTQDSGYLRTVAARGRKEIERLGQDVAIDGVTKTRGKQQTDKIFYDHNGEPLAKRARLSDERTATSNVESEIHANNAEETKQYNDYEDVSKSEGVVPRSKSKKQIEREKEMSTRLKVEKRRRKLLKERRAVKLLELKKRQKEILAAADQLELQRATMAKAIGGTNKNGVKFKLRERKR